MEWLLLFSVKNAMHCRLKESHVRIGSERAAPQTPVHSLEQFSDVIQKSQRLLSLLWSAQGLILELEFDCYALELNFKLVLFSV